MIPRRLSRAPHSSFMILRDSAAFSTLYSLKISPKILPRLSFHQVTSSFADTDIYVSKVQNCSYKTNFCLPRQICFVWLPSQNSKKTNAICYPGTFLQESWNGNKIKGDTKIFLFQFRLFVKKNNLFETPPRKIVNFHRKYSLKDFYCLGISTELYVRNS